MKQPPLKTRILGSPVVVLPMLAAFLWATYRLMTEGDAMLPGVIVATLCTALAMRAHTQVHAYRLWRRTWDSMGDVPPHQPRRVKPVLGVVALIIAVLGIIANIHRPDMQGAVGWSVLLAAAVLAFHGVRGGWRTLTGKRAGKTDLVRICTAPASRAPTLATAYDALPDYCWAIMGGR